MPSDDSSSEPPGDPKACSCGPDEACGDPCTPEPPMTAEEEEEAPEDDSHEAPCPRCEGEPHNPHVWDAPDVGASFCRGWAPPPPQPVRRPPYAVAYSVQGHLYEVALPGDAMVRAVDGALVIQHHLGPVAAIVQVLPVINEGGASGADPDGD